MTTRPMKNQVDPSSSALLSVGIVEVTLQGNLSKLMLAKALDAADATLSASQERLPLLVDCSSMTGYDTEARDYFVSWNKVARTRVRRLAVVTQRTMWHLVVSGMALASGQAMKAFDDRASALRWLKLPA